MDYHANDELKDIIQTLMRYHVGQENKISRANLVYQVNLYYETSDRKIRDAISELPILSTSSGDGGYWWIGSQAELNAWANEMTSRAYQLFDRVKMVRDWWNENQQPVKYEQVKLIEVMV